MKSEQFNIETIAQDEFDIKQLYDALKRHHYFRSWGVSKLRRYENKVLVFKVNGFLYKGDIYISLAWDDTFTITTTKKKRVPYINNEYRTLEFIKDTKKGVYIDELVYVLDAIIEKDPEQSDEVYKEKVNESLQKFILKI